MNKLFKFLLGMFIFGVVWAFVEINIEKIHTGPKREKGAVHTCREMCDTVGVVNGQKYVDLALPSGNLWATMNVGAKAPQEYGTYVAWGEVTEYHSWSSFNIQYKFYKKEETKDTDGFSVFKEGYTKYVPQSSPEGHGFDGFYDNLYTLQMEDDFAHATMGGSWRIPTSCDFEELMNWCTWETAFLNDQWGVKFVSTENGNWLFLPMPSTGEQYWINLLTNNMRFAYCFKVYGDERAPKEASTLRTDAALVRGVCPMKRNKAE